VIGFKVVDQQFSVMYDSDCQIYFNCSRLSRVLRCQHHTAEKHISPSHFKLTLGQPALF